MRLVHFTDERGYKYVSMVRDSDPDESAPEGIIQGPPDVEFLDWDDIKRRLHNALVDRGLFDYNDLVRQQVGVQGAILSTLKRPVVELYKEHRDGK